MDNSLFRVKIVNIRPKRNVPFATGEFSFKEHVLEQLPRYFQFIDLMRKVDDDAYALFARVGASILPRDKAIVTLDPVFANTYYNVDTIPAFGCVYLPGNNAANKNITPEFVWWKKLEKGPRHGVEASPGPVYHVTALYHDEGKAAAPVSWHVEAPTFATARILKEYCFEKRSMYDPRSQWDRRHYSIPQSTWSYPAALRHVAADQPGRSPKEFGLSVFTMAATGIMSRSTGFQVRVAKFGRHAVFNIDDSVSSNFFSDRDVMVNENGRTKKIFHFVAGYQRTDGKLITGHTKGLREFNWNGYNVHIGKPQMDFANPDNLTAPSVTVDDVDATGGGYMTMAEIGVAVQKHIREHAAIKRGRTKRRKRS